MAKLFKNFYSLFLILLNRVLLRKPDFSEKRIFLQGQLLDNINNEVIYIKYDNDEMKYLYYCVHCDNFWKL